MDGICIWSIFVTLNHTAMKKTLRILSIALLCLSANFAKASGGPDAYGYTWMTSLDAGGPAFNWIDITSRAGVQTVTGLADDNSAPGQIPLGINFHYYWNDYTQLKVGSNGWVSFSNVSNIASCFPTIPTAGGPEDYLAPMMSDLNFTGAGNIGQVKYWSNNVDTFIISYINVPFWSVNAPGWAGSNSFQVILCNSDSSITYQYGSVGTGFANGAACIDLTVGIENSTGSVGLQVHSDAVPPSNYVIRFDYPATVLLSVLDVLPRWNLHSDNSADFIMMNIPYAIRSDIHNAGNTNITTSTGLQSTILDATSTTVYNSAGTLPTSAAGSDTIFSFTPAWTPTAIGQYTNRTTTSNAQDINPANDTRNTELEVVNPCATNMPLSYVSGAAPGASINWNGGANDDGVAVYFVPPVYPYTVNTLQYYISSNVSNGYIAQIYDDDGPSGSQGTLLFNTTIPSSSVVSGSWNTVNVTSTVTLNNGGFYVVWLQGGTTIFIGAETTGPRCHRNYEILDGSWAQLRYDDNEDMCIRANITGYTTTPTASYTSSSTLLTTDFFNTTTGLATSWSWDFGDGSPVSTLQNPSHTYVTAGTYTVCLTATSPCGSNQSCQTITVCSPPTAFFSSSATFLDATFTDASAGTVNSWHWDFGDGNTSTQQNPTHTYASPGTYNVCLITSNGCAEADTTCQPLTICGQLTTAFTTTSIEDTLYAMDQTTGAVTWLWDFGDGNTSTLQNPSHQYFVGGGSYVVCLSTTDVCGNTDSVCQTVTIIVTDVNGNNASVISGTFPNPVNDLLNISFGNNLRNAQLEIIDPTGKIVAKMENVSGTKLSMNVGEFSAGIYLVRVWNENSSSTSRFIKE
jgi:PKD repeat protein